MDDDAQDLMYLSHIGLVALLREFVHSHGRSLHLSSPHTCHRSPHTSHRAHVRYATFLN